MDNICYLLCLKAKSHLCESWWEECEVVVTKVEGGEGGQRQPGQVSMSPSLSLSSSIIIISITILIVNCGGRAEAT